MNRRGFLGLLLVTLIPWKMGLAATPVRSAGLVLVDGWILRADDLDEA